MWYTFKKLCNANEDADLNEVWINNTNFTEKKRLNLTECHGKHKRKTNLSLCHFEYMGCIANETKKIVGIFHIFTVWKEYTEIYTHTCNVHVDRRIFTQSSVWQVL